MRHLINALSDKYPDKKMYINAVARTGCTIYFLTFMIFSDSLKKYNKTRPALKKGILSAFYI